MANPLYYVRFEGELYRGFRDKGFLWDKPFETLEAAQEGAPAHSAIWIYKCHENRLSCISYRRLDSDIWEVPNG